MSVFGGFKLGQYRHWKKGATYIAYDVVVDEETQKEKVCYLRLSDGSKHARFLDKFTANTDPGRQAENETGQRQVFKLMDTSVTVHIGKPTSTPSEPAVLEGDKMIKPEVVGELFTSMTDFLSANGIPMCIAPKMGDTVGVWTPLVDDHSNVNTFTITGITNQGFYVGAGKGHAFLPWNKLLTITISFK